MAMLDGPLPSPGRRVLSSASLLRAWAGPAAVCGLGVTGVFLVDPFAGGLVGIAGVAYLVTSLLLVVGVITLSRAGPRRPRPPVVVLTVTWTSAWVSGVVTFGVIALVLGALDADSGVPTEGFVISPVFWLLSFPAYLVFLVAALLFRVRDNHPRGRPPQPPSADPDPGTLAFDARWRALAGPTAPADPPVQEAS